MSSFNMSKAQLVVLFDLMGASAIPVGILDIPQVEKYEYRSIVNLFFENHLIDKISEHFRPDKGLEKFLLPIVKSKKIMLFNYGINESCIFNASLYFSECGLVALLDNNDDTLKFLIINSVNDLLLFIPDIREYMVNKAESEPYISYILFGTDYSIIHCAKIDLKKRIAKIIEGKRDISSTPIEAEHQTDILRYNEMLHEKLKEIYNAVGC